MTSLQLCRALEVVVLCECGCGQPAPIASQTITKRGIRKGDHLPFIHGHNARGIRRTAETLRRMSAASIGKGKRGRNGKWKGGVQMRGGRKLVLVGPDHPMATKSGYVLEHRLVMAAVLGRYLSSAEHVHHINLDPTNNRPENLVVLTRSQHMRVHRLIDRRGMDHVAALDLVLSEIRS